VIRLGRGLVADYPAHLGNWRFHPEFQLRGRILDLVLTDAPHRVLNDPPSKAGADRWHYGRAARLPPGQDEYAGMIVSANAPVHIYFASRNRKRAVLERVDRQFMQKQGEALRRLLPHHHIDPIESDPLGKGGGLSFQNLSQQSTLPLLFVNIVWARPSDWSRSMNASRASASERSAVRRSEPLAVQQRTDFGCDG
jgi:hypothetical protein